MPDTIHCGHCGGANPAGNRFCGHCGQPLAAEPSVAPSETMEERRLATVVFADLSGFTELSGRSDPEDVRALVDASMALLGEIIDRYGGHVDKIIGDAVLALWGVPTSEEDHAERAVRAALEMQECARTHPDEFGGLPLRIGVNTGELLFAPVGPRTRREQTVMGDVVNIASRLQTSAPRGGVLVGETTWRETRRAIRYEQVEPFTVKGRAEPLDGWLAVAPLASAPTERPLSTVPMIGRARELRVLLDTWDETVSERAPHLVVVLGAPGVGKSRLCRELRTAVEGRGARAIRTRSLPYGSATGYGAFADTIRDATGILDTDDGATARAKLTKHVESTPGATATEETAAALATMAGVGTSEVATRSVLFDAACGFVEGLAAARPLLLGFEDIHWADASFLDLLEHVARHARAPLMILASARPELLDARPSFGHDVPAYLPLELDALDAGSADDLAREVLRGHPVAPAVLEHIRDAAAGNPLFIEELAASVAEGTTDPTEELPTSVVSIIAARLDAMPARPRQVLLDASVVGRTFWCELLAGLDPDPGLDEALVWLQDHDYVRREPASDLGGDEAYSFRHGLLREVAYNTLPRSERRVRHAAVARLAESRFPERPRTLATVLAHHWREAGDADRAIDYLLEAADQASQAWAKREAVVLYSEALDLLADDDARRRTVVLRRAVADQQIRHVEFGDVAPPSTVGDIAPS